MSRVNYRATPLFGPGEDHIENERRSRAEVEQGFNRTDVVLDELLDKVERLTPITIAAETTSYTAGVAGRFMTWVVPPYLDNHRVSFTQIVNAQSLTGPTSVNSVLAGFVSSNPSSTTNAQMVNPEDTVTFHRPLLLVNAGDTVTMDLTFTGPATLRTFTSYSVIQGVS